MTEPRRLPTTPRADQLAGLVDRIAPGARVVRTRRLPGGLSCRMDMVEVEREDGERRKYTLRRFASPRSTPERVEIEYRVIELVAREGIAAPCPVLLDAEGQLFDAPAIVLSYLPGRPVFPRQNIEPWIKGLAAALVSVHGVTPDRVDLSALEIRGSERARNEIDRFDDAASRDRLIGDVQQTARSALGRIEFGRRALIHDDFWPGNTIWHAGQLTGIVDWSSAKVGDPREDISQCRVDLMFSHDLSVADAFRTAYESQSGYDLRQLWFFDLIRSVPALIKTEYWLRGYHDLGLRHLTVEAVAGRLRHFVQRALSRSLDEA